MQKTKVSSVSWHRGELKSHQVTLASCTACTISVHVLSLLYNLASIGFYLPSVYHSPWTKKEKQKVKTNKKSWYSYDTVKTCQKHNCNIASKRIRQKIKKLLLHRVWVATKAREVTPSSNESSAEAGGTPISDWEVTASLWNTVDNELWMLSNTRGGVPPLDWDIIKCFTVFGCQEECHNACFQAAAVEQIDSSSKEV